MEFEWDENKRTANLAKHSIDFADAVTLFELPHVIARARPVGGESRWMLTARFGGVFLSVVFTRRGEVIRLISVRSARREERERYRQIHGG